MYSTKIILQSRLPTYNITDTRKPAQKTVY